MTAETRVLVVEVARGIVTALDPRQEKYLDADADAYFADPDRALSAAGSDRALGSGWETIGQSLTIVALFVGQKALDMGVENAIDNAVGGILRSRRKPQAPDLPPLTGAQAEKIRRSVVAAAGAHGLDPTAAYDLAQAVVKQFPETRAKD
jgi:hypothetical protein